MSRNVRKKQWSCTLPGGRKVAGVLPDCLLTDRAIELVPKNVDDKPAAVQRRSSSNLLRLCVREIDGDELGYMKLQGRKFDREFDPRETALLEQMFQRLTQPTEAEQEHFNDSLSVSENDGSYYWEGEFVENETLRRLEEIEDERRDWTSERDKLSEDIDLDAEESDRLEQRINAINDDLEALDTEEEHLLEDRLWLRGVLPGTGELDRSVEQVPSDKQQRPALAQKTAMENIIRNCVKAYEYHDGEARTRVPVKFTKLRGVKLDAHFTPKEQNAIVVGIMGLSEPDKDEVRDFMDTVTVK